MPESNLIADRPVFAGILIDCSGSMRPYVKDVIEGHRVMIDALRKSEKCEMGVLWIYQSLFSDVPQILNPFYALRPNGEDGVSVLDASNYRPDGCTALYDAVLAAAKAVEAHCVRAFERGLPSDARLVVITDGVDSCSRTHPEDVQLAIKALHAREWLCGSVLIGLQNQQFDGTHLNAVQQALGFSHCILLGQGQKEIRRAFQYTWRVVSR